MVEDIVNEIVFHTGINKETILLMGNMVLNNRFYKRAAIAKKDGSKRIIYLPDSELKLVQHFIVSYYFSSYKFDRNIVTAYIKGSSVKNNALQHRFNEHFLFIDIHDFFNSIDFDLLLEIMIKIFKNYDKKSLEFLLDICSYKRKFVQGCVSSPFLSNIYMADFDNNILQAIKDFDTTIYTRYSDDITFSSKNLIDNSISLIVENGLKSLKLRINYKKTHFSSNLQNVKVTGLRIKGNGFVSLDTKFKKKLKNEIYICLHFPETSKDLIEQVIGKLSYLKSIDPYYYNKLNIKY